MALPDSGQRRGRRRSVGRAGRGDGGGAPPPRRRAPRRPRPSDALRPWTIEPAPRKPFEDIVRLAAASELSAAHDLSRLCESAQRHGVELLLLKGAALAYTHYRRPYLRPRNDIDLFLRRADLGRAEELLASLGYERAPEADAELWTGQRHYSESGSDRRRVRRSPLESRKRAGVCRRPDVRGRLAPVGGRAGAWAVRAHVVGARRTAAGVHPPGGPSPGSREPPVAVGHSPHRLRIVRGRVGGVRRSLDAGADAARLRAQPEAGARILWHRDPGRRVRGARCGG